jgi:hypothetical protein
MVVKGVLALRTVVSIFAITCAIIVTGVLSGQIVPSDRTAARAQSPTDARSRALHALDAIDRRIAEIDVLLAAGEGGNASGEELLARSRAIRTRVTESDPSDASQRGAWAGLRASIADLEFRTDILVLMARSRTMGFGEAAQPMIDETKATTDVLGAKLDAQGRLDYGARLERMRTELERLRLEAADDVPSSAASDETRTAWAKRLANLRRELRSISHRHANRNAARPSR